MLKEIKNVFHILSTKLLLLRLPWSTAQDSLLCLKLFDRFMTMSYALSRVEQKASRKIRGCLAELPVHAVLPVHADTGLAWLTSRKPSVECQHDIVEESKDAHPQLPGAELSPFAVNWDCHQTCSKFSPNCRVGQY